jgi:hypothetical protein
MFAFSESWQQPNYRTGNKNKTSTTLYFIKN